MRAENEKRALHISYAWCSKKYYQNVFFCFEFAGDAEEAYAKRAAAAVEVGSLEVDAEKAAAAEKS